MAAYLNKKKEEKKKKATPGNCKPRKLIGESMVQNRGSARTFPNELPRYTLQSIRWCPLVLIV